MTLGTRDRPGFQVSGTGRLPDPKPLQSGPGIRVDVHSDPPGRSQGDSTRVGVVGTKGGT